jgi:hypothetical protein
MTGRRTRRNVTLDLPAAAHLLSGVSATSASDVWAVGGYVTPTNLGGQPLIMHWNGTAWKQA